MSDGGWWFERSVMMTEQAFPVSPLTEMLGMFSVMAEQYVSNLGLPQCYEKGGGGGEKMGGERVQEGDRAGGRAGGGIQGVRRDYLFARYLSMEVENSSGRVVKEKDGRVQSRKRLRMAACSDLSGC